MEKIKESIEYFKRYERYGSINKHKEQLQPLLDLAEKVLAIEGVMITEEEIYQTLSRADSAVHSKWIHDYLTAYTSAIIKLLESKGVRDVY